MAVTPNSLASVFSFASSATYSLSLNNAAGAYLVADIYLGYPGAQAAPTSVTYNGVAMTSLGFVAGSSGLTRTYRYVLASPALGSNTFQVTMPGSLFGFGCLLRTYTATGTISAGALASATGTGTGPTVNAAAAVGDLVTDAVFGFDMPNSGTNFTAGAGQTKDTEFNGGQSTGGGTGSRETAAGTSVTMNWTSGASLTEWAIVASALSDSGSGGGVSIPVVMAHLRQQGIA